MRQFVAPDTIAYHHDIVDVFHRHDGAIRSRSGQKPVCVNLQIGNLCQLEQHPDVRAPLAKASKLASEIVAATGLCCLRASVLAGHAGFSRAMLGGIADRDSKGCRIWLPSTKAAERVIAETFRTHGTRRGATLVIEAAPDEADRLLRDSARLLGIAVLDDERVNSLMTSLTKRIEAAIKTMGRAGTLKQLRRVTEHDLTGLLARQA